MKVIMLKDPATEVWAQVPISEDVWNDDRQMIQTIHSLRSALSSIEETREKKRETKTPAQRSADDFANVSKIAQEEVITLKERAKALARSEKIRKYEDLALEADGSFEFGYMVGATEQRQIDEKSQIKEMRELNADWMESLRIQRKILIEKACEWLWENIGHYVNEQGFVETHHLDKDFCKALEK